MLKLKIAAALTVSVAFFVLIYNFSLDRLHQDLYERFPELDHQVVRDAYRQFMRKAAKGEVKVEGLDDFEMDLLFLHEVMELSSK